MALRGFTPPIARRIARRAGGLSSSIVQEWTRPTYAHLNTAQGYIVSFDNGVADVLVMAASKKDLLETIIKVVDLSECIFDEHDSDLLGVWVWASEQHTDEGVKWCADNRCCV